MRIVTNTRLAKRNRQIATYMFFLTMLVLIGSFFLINQSLFTDETGSALALLAQAAAIPLAFILTLISVRMTNLWARRPYPEDVIADGLKGLSKKSVLYNYYHFPARHVLICPQGIFVIVTRWHEGRFSVDGDRWRSHQGIFSKVMSTLRMDGLGNPSMEAERAVAQIEKKLNPLTEDEIDIQPIIVFTGANVQIDIKDSEIPILFADPKQKPNLIDYMRDLNRDTNADRRKPQAKLPLSEDEIQAFEKATVS